ncbi:MAG: right-handed parallel beta-helix repeat-containing protein [Candidatus Zipacnadales bacterium]
MISLLALHVSADPQPGTFYVSPRGNDRWSGTLAEPNAARTDGPFRSLHRAQEAVRQTDRHLDRCVILEAGTYFIEEPLLLGPEDSGTAEHPVVWRAEEDATVVLSGGRPVVGWEQVEGNLWKASIPELRGGDWYLRQLRVGEQLQTLARHPNAVPDKPYTGGWLFAETRVSPEGRFGGTVANIHTPGDWIEWEIDVPAEGDYALWVLYGAKNEPFGRTDMAGRTVFQVDGGEDVPLQNLPDTAGWSSFQWSRCATLHLKAGKRLLRWTNRQGGGINFDAFALCTDPNWTPQGTDLAPPNAAAHLLVVQAEAWSRAEGREMTRDIYYPASPHVLPFREGDIPDGFDVRGADVMVFPAWGWVGGPVEVGGIDYTERILTLTGGNAQQEIRRGNRYYLRNVRQALDLPGEFFVDDTAGEILLVPYDANFQDQGVIAPRFDRIIHVKGDPEKGLWAEHIHFTGLTFRDTTYSCAIPSLYQDPDAAIWLEYARECVIENCHFTQLGGNGVNLTRNSNGCKILGCTMIELGGGGVIMTGDTLTQPTNCVVAGCTMRDLGRIYKHVAGVYVTTGSGHRIAHNTITDVPRYGISFKSYNEQSYSHDNVAEFNELLRTNLETNDTGAIETLGRDRQRSGNIIRYNLILDVVGMKHLDEGGLISPFYTWGIYLDDYSSGTLVQGNIVARTYRGGLHVHLGFDNVCVNNIFVDGHLQQHEYNGAAEMRRNVFRRNIVVYSNPEALYARASGWDRAVLSECDHNLIWWSGGRLGEIESNITPEGSWAKWLAAGFDVHSRIADPLFVDPERDDYRLQDGSPAFDLGFEPIPTERIGVKGYVAEDWR